MKIYTDEKLSFTHSVIWKPWDILTRWSEAECWL